MMDRLPFQVAFITGQSDPQSCALSPIQREFLASLELPEQAGHALNFPYRAGGCEHAPTPIILASLHNLRLYLRSRRAEFASTFRPAVIDMLGRSDHTVFLSGSCGLELLANLELPSEWRARISVFAYGPVARARPPLRCVMVQGRHDHYSRWCFREVEHVVSCGHLDYLGQPEVRRLCREFLAETLQQMGIPHEP